MRRYVAALAAMVLPVSLMGQVMADKAPANTVLYVGFRGGEALKAQYQGSHLRGVLEGTDWDVVTSEKFQQQLAKLISRQDDALGEAWPAISQAFETALPHPTVLCVGLDQKGTPTLALICDAGNDVAGVLEKFKTAVPAGSSLRPQQQGKYVVMTDRPEDVLPLLKGSDAKAGLAGVPEFASAMKQVDTNGAVTLFVNTKAIAGIMANKAGNEATRTLSALGLDQVQAVAASGNFAGQGWENQVFLLAPGARSGVTALLENQPLTDATLKLVPATATRCSISHLDLARVYDTIHNSMAKADPNSVRDLDQAMRMATNTLGVDLVKQVFPALGDEWVLYTDPNVGGSQPMGIVMANRLRDPAKAEAALTQIHTKLLTFARAGVEPKQMTIPSSEKEVNGTKVHVISLPIVTPAWAIRDGVLYVGLYPQTVVAAAQFAGSGQPSIAESPAFTAAKKAAGVTPQSFSYTDLPRAADAGYGFALLWTRYIGLLDLMGLETPTMPLPTLTALKPHLGPVTEVTWTNADGWHMRVSEPFPGGQVLGAIMTSDFLGASAPLSASILLPSLARAREQANRVKCASNMRQIGVGTILYAQDHKGKLPAELGDLVLEGNMAVEVFTCPTVSDGIPAIVRQSPREEQAEWVNQNSDYVYLGTGMDANQANPHLRPVLYEKLDDHQRQGANVLFADGHVEFVDPVRFQRLIASATKPAKK